MMEQDIFYRVYGMSLKTKKNLLEDAKKLSFEWWVDILDCSKSFARKKINMSFKEIMSKLSQKSHFVVINRKERGQEKEYGEIGFSTMTFQPEHFLWVYISKKDLDKLVSEYKLDILKT